MRKCFVLILLVALILVACIGNQSSTRPSSQTLVPTVISQTSIAAPTIEYPSPTTPSLTSTSTLAPATATVSPTPTASLFKGQALIAYETAGSSDKRLVLLDLSDGTSVEFNFPNGAFFATPFLNGLSPDARYFVYYEGGRVEMYDQLIAESPDFVMRVFDLDRQEVIFSTPLLSPEYPQNLKPIVEMTTDQYWMHETDRMVMLEDMYDTMQQTMMDYMRTVTWSPDGNLLAFASENPGPTSDMYFFDPLSGDAWRVTSEPRNVFGLTWAPDSSAIALETTLYYTQATRVTTDLLTRDGTLLGSVEYIYYFRDWVGSDKILLQRFIDFGDQFADLTLMSAIDDSRITLWEGSLEEFAFSPDLSSYMITSSQPNEPGQSPGLYLMMSGTETPLHLSESRFWKVAYWGSDQFAYGASAPDKGIRDEPQVGGTYGVSKTGELTLIDEGNWYFLPSPDGKFLVAYGPFDRITGLRVFGGDGKLLATLSDEKITCLAWDEATDSLAYQIGKILYIWQEGDEAARQVATQLEDEQDYRECGFTWVNLAP